MDRRLQLSLVAAMLLAGGGAWLYLQADAPGRHGAVKVAQQQSDVEHCMYAAQMAFDVHWAAACMAQGGADDSAECDLPDDRAAVVNAWLNDAQKRCTAQARAAP